jgi:hypothetical protein
MRASKFAVVFLIFTSLFLASNAGAWTEKSLEASDPFVFKPNDLDLEQFSLESSVAWRFVPGSFEWVRVDRKYLIPRARVVLSVPAGTPVTYHGRVFQNQSNEIEIPIALSQEKGNEVSIGGATKGRVRVRYSPKRPLKVPMILDSTCSSSSIRIESPKLEHSWGHVYCHSTHLNQDQGYGLRMDVDVHWETDTGESYAQIGNLKDESADGVTHGVSFYQGSPSYEFRKGRDSFVLTAPMPARFHPFSVSLGLGPYSHREVLRPFATLYAAYLFNDGLKMASFTALPLKASPEIDTGVYVIVEQFRGIDERVTMNLLLGAHALNFQASGQNTWKMSAPQGVEMGFRDCLVRGQNFTLGGFFYPKIDNRYYVNAWIRYGNSKFFTEFNFINWQEPLGADSAFAAKSAGISIGFPLFRAF